MSDIDLSFREQYLSDLEQNGFLPSNGQWGYQICDCLKRSNHSAVFLVEMQGSSTKVVLKVSDGTVNLENEFAVLQCLGNRENLHVPTPIAFWRHKEKQYMLRQLVEGSTLQELHDEYGDLTEQQVRRIGMLLCEELYQFHRRGLIHRDIKPENVVLTAGGNAYLIDLGTMRVYQKNGGADTLCLGTKEYAAPEQYGFQQSDVPTDIYAMGKLLLYLLTGTTELDTLKSAHLSRAMKAVIRRCTAFDPKKRICSMKLLRRYLDGSVRMRRIVMSTLSSLTAVSLLVTGALCYAHDNASPYARIGSKRFSSLESALQSVDKFTDVAIDLRGEHKLTHCLYTANRNITLRGEATITNDVASFTDQKLIDVSTSDTLTLGKGVIIQGNGDIATFSSFGHVVLDGGVISGARQENEKPALFNMQSATFEMRSGTISSGTRADWTVINTGTFTMTGGELVSNATTGNAMLNQGVAHFSGGAISAPQCDNSGFAAIHDDQGGVSTNSGTTLLIRSGRVN